MGPKGNWKKANKAHTPNVGNKNLKFNRNRVSVVAPVTAPVTPPPLVSSTISTLKFPEFAAQPVDFVPLAKKWCIQNRVPVIKPIIKKSYFVDQTEVVLPEEPNSFCFLNKGNVVHVSQANVKIPDDAPLSSWSEISYQETSYHNDLRKWITTRINGWVNDVYLEDYSEIFPNFEVEIPHATKNSNDAQQYMTIEDEGFDEFRIRTNMCGELCVAFIVKQDIDTVLANWKANGKKNYYQSFVGKGQNKPLQQAQVKDILDLYYPNAEEVGPYKVGTVAVPLAAPSSGVSYPQASSDLQERLKTHYLIMLLRIDVNTGELIATDTPDQRNHWVVVDKITRKGNGVELYNPFPNKRQEYSFSEFYRSVGSNPMSGLWVKREREHPEGHETVPPKFEVAIDNPNPSYSAAQYIDVDGKKKTNLCGEFCVAFILKESINAVLEQWKAARPILYAEIVGNNETTGPEDLITILRAYGYNTEGDFIDLARGLTDPFLKAYTPSLGRIVKMLKTHFLIAGVMIDRNTGRLKGGNGIGHWVVVDRITPVERNGGWVELYNPFMNSREEYSYRELMSSANNWSTSGLWVKRHIVPVFVPQADVPVVHTEVPGDKARKPRKSGRAEKWSEERLSLEVRKRLNVWKPKRIVAALAGKSKSGWRPQAIMNMIKEMSRWPETKLRLEIEKRRKAGQPQKKMAAELVKKGSGWKPQDIIRINREMTAAAKWTEEQLSAALQERLSVTRSVSKAITRLAEVSGWSRQDIFRKLKQVVKEKKWTEEQLRTVIEEELRDTKSTNKVAAELCKISGWKKRDIYVIAKIMKGARAGTPDEARIFATHVTIEVDPETIVQASKPLAEFVKWQNSLLSVHDSKLYRVRKWGDPVMVKYGLDVNYANTTNFQAVGLYNNGNKEFGAISNFIRIPREDVIRLLEMQIEDNYVAKREDWRAQKMSWLFKPSGTIYFSHQGFKSWRTASYIEWGTLALGGNLVQVVGTETICAKMRDGITRDIEMARLKGFRRSDWNRPLDDLLAEGLVHRCFCAYKSNHFGDSPKGIVYSPFYCPVDWEFGGKAQADTLYIPTEWLEPKKS